MLAGRENHVCLHQPPHLYSLPPQMRLSRLVEGPLCIPELSGVSSTEAAVHMPTQMPTGQRGRSLHKGHHLYLYSKGMIPFPLPYVNTHLIWSYLHSIVWEYKLKSDVASNYQRSIRSIRRTIRTIREVSEVSENYQRSN